MVSEEKKDESAEGVARGSASTPVPAREAPVEYIDATAGMDAALKALQERVRNLERLLGRFEEMHAEKVTAVNQQGREMQKFVQSISRRVSNIRKAIAELARPQASG